MSDTEADSHTVYLTGDNNFRKTIYPAYKAQRPTVKPKWLEVIRAHLVTEWGATITDGYEADDALGIDQTTEIHHGFEGGEGIVICSIDKDLLMIPGQHYNFVHQKWTWVMSWDGLVSFYTSLLVGDAVDNIKGCPGIGKAKAPRLLEGCKTEWEMYQACLKQYQQVFKENAESELLLNGQLLWIWRHLEDLWTPPQPVETNVLSTDN